MNYLAYGSNLHPRRLSLRAPDSRLVGAVQLAACRLVFHKQGSDGSAKCGIEFTDNPADVAHAVVYDVSDSDEHSLDEAEGLGAGYLKQQLAVSCHGQLLPVFVYVASPSHIVADLAPYHWYKDLVLAGARRHGFPPSYVREIAAVESMSDLNDARRIAMESLLLRLHAD